MIKSITSSIIFRGRERGPTWFHPRACMLPDGTALMTCQNISGSDYFGQVHWTTSVDNGATWRRPEPIVALGRRRLPDEPEIEEGVCDVVPEYHPRTGVVLAMGHNVYYKDGALTRPNEGRYTVYVVRSADGTWSARRTLAWDNPEATAIYTAGCAQRVTLPDGDLLVPLSFGPLGRRDRAVTTVRCAFDGERVTVQASGNALHLAVGRGLLEPSLAAWQGRVYMTIRAEDGHGYVSVSDDGLHWPASHPWCWDDGEPLTMSTTQQRWLVHSERLFLVYTRKAVENVNVMRWRAPLYVVQVAMRDGVPCLRRETERVVLPLIGDGVNDADHVARMGNFHVTNVSPAESWVTVGETLPSDGWRGNTLLARIHWAVPNACAL